MWNISWTGLTLDSLRDRNGLNVSTAKFPTHEHDVLTSAGHTHISRMVLPTHIPFKSLRTLFESNAIKLG